MKFAATLAILALSAQALNLSADVATEVATETEAKVEATAEATAEAGAGYNGPIVPENYDYAVHDFNLDSPFTDQDCYQKQLDIYSDQIIAIEALRLEVLPLTQRITQAEWDYEKNAADIAANHARIHDNAKSALHNKAKIDVLYQDVHDVADCLSRQWDEQKTLRSVLELYSHQFTYVAHLPHQCVAILGSGSHLHSAYAWPSNDHVEPEHYGEPAHY